jgi:hypothetical protein
LAALSDTVTADTTETITTLTMITTMATMTAANLMLSQAARMAIPVTALSVTSPMIRSLGHISDMTV